MPCIGNVNFSITKFEMANNSDEPHRTLHALGLFTFNVFKKKRSNDKDAALKPLPYFPCRVLRGWGWGNGDEIFRKEEEEEKKIAQYTLLLVLFSRGRYFFFVVSTRDYS